MNAKNMKVIFTIPLIISALYYLEVLSANRKIIDYDLLTQILIIVMLLVSMASLLINGILKKAARLVIYGLFFGGLFLYVLTSIIYIKWVITALIACLLLVELIGVISKNR